MAEPTPSLSTNGTVDATQPNRRANDRLRGGRKHLTEREIEKLMATARREDRYGHRDATAILIAFRHGLRVSELCDLSWDQIDFTRSTLTVRRAKGGEASTHFLNGSELRALRQLRRDTPASRYVFTTERDGPVTTAWFRKMLARLGPKADMSFPIHPHMLRHACGFHFANQGKDTRSLQAYLGHRNIQSTAIYTAMSPDRFRGWEKE